MCSLISATVLVYLFQSVATYPRNCPEWVGSPPAMASFYDDESSCYVFINERTTWNTANMICSENGWSLAKVESEKVQSFIERNVVYGGGIWIGLRDVEEEGIYRWTDGSRLENLSERLLYSLFFNHGYDCLAVVKHIFGTFVLQELSCEHERSFVCQTSATYVTTASPALTKADNRHPEPSAKEFVRVACNSKSITNSEPGFSTRGRLHICSRECKQRNCAMFNFHRPTNTCNEGWEVWTGIK